MERVVRAVLMLSAYGLVLSICEQALPRTGVGKSAKTAIGLLLLRLLAEQIAGILQ